MKIAFEEVTSPMGVINKVIAGGRHRGWIAQLDGLHWFYSLDRRGPNQMYWNVGPGLNAQIRDEAVKCLLKTRPRYRKR